MGKYLAEFYLACHSGLAVDEIVARAQRAAEQLSAEGVPVVFLQSIYVPEDETWFCLYETESVELVHAAVRRAELSCERIVPAQQIADPAAVRVLRPVLESAVHPSSIPRSQKRPSQ